MLLGFRVTGCGWAASASTAWRSRGRASKEQGPSPFCGFFGRCGCLPFRTSIRRSDSVPGGTLTTFGASLILFTRGSFFREQDDLMLRAAIFSWQLFGAGWQRAVTLDGGRAGAAVRTVTAGG